MLINRFLNKLTGTQRKVVTNVFWAVAGKIVTLFSTLIVSILVARYLGPERFGTMNYVVSVVSLFGIFATFGMTDIVIRELSKKDIPENVILGTAFTLRIILSFLAIIGILTYSLFYEDKKDIIYMMAIYSIYLIFACFDVIRSYFTAIIQNKRVVLSEISRSLCGACVKIVLILCHAPLIYFIAALTLDFVLLALGYYVNYQQVADCKKWKFDLTTAAFLLKSSFPLVVAGATAIIYQRIDQVMIAKIIDNTSVGYFSTALSFVGIVTFVPTIMIQTVGPLLVGFKKSDPKKYELESQRMMNVIVWFTIIACCIISCLSYPIIRYSYGIEYLAAVPVMQIAVFKAVGVALTMVGGQLIIIENIHKFAFIRNILACIVCIACNYWLIPRYGIIGSAWATLATVFFSGGFGNLFIPAYHHILKKQSLCILLGWKDIFKIKDIIKK